MTKLLRFSFIFAAVSGATGPLAFAKIEFNRDIRPIFSDTCFQCHGPDLNQRKASGPVAPDTAAKMKEKRSSFVMEYGIKNSTGRPIS